MNGTVPAGTQNIVYKTLGSAVSSFAELFWPLLVVMAMFGLIGIAAFVWGRFRNMG
jgi:hypothetical protein